MSRHSSGGSSDHRIKLLWPGCYELHWVVDRYYSGSRLRFPTGYTKMTDEKGAARFAKKWDVDMPVPKTA